MPRPEEYESEASALSGASGSGVSSGVTDGTNSYGLDVGDVGFSDTVPRRRSHDENHW